MQFGLALTPESDCGGSSMFGSNCIGTEETWYGPIVLKTPEQLKRAFAELQEARS
jgi:redox-sensitive bicupin YhaK (pirin superfamily)